MSNRKKISLAALISSLAIGLLFTMKVSNTTTAFSERTRQIEEQAREQNEKQAKELLASGIEKARAGLNSFRYDLYADALIDLEKARELDPNNPAIHYYAAQVQAKLGDLDGMIESYDKTIEIFQESGNTERVESLRDEKRRFILEFDDLQKF